MLFVGLGRLVGTAVAEHLAKRPVEDPHLGRVCDQHRAHRPVQPPPGLRADERQRPGEVGRPRGRHRHPRLVQPLRERAGQRPAGRARPSRRRTPDQPRRVTRSSRPAARTTSWSSLVLEHRAQRPAGRPPHPASRRRAAAAPTASRSPRRSPAASARRWRACRETASATCTASVCDEPRTRRRTISTARGGVRVVDPVVEAAALDRVVQVARAVGRQHDRPAGASPGSCPARGSSRRLGQQLEQERLEVVVGAVDLVDQQHGRPRAGMLERPQQRPPDQVVGPEQVVLARATSRPRRPAGC